MPETTERLRSYLAALPPRAQALLVREFERAIEKGDNAAVATYVLGELRRIAQPEEVQAVERIDDPMRLLFRPFEPFLSNTSTARSGTISRSFLMQVWQWLRREGATAAIERLTAALQVTKDASRSADRNFAISDFQRSVAVALAKIAAAPPDEQKAVLARMGGNAQAEDLTLLADLLRAREALDELILRLPPQVRDLGPAQIELFLAALASPALQTKAVMPFALTLAMKSLQSPWQIIRLAIISANSNSESRLASTPFAVGVSMAIQDLAIACGQMREDLRRSQIGAAQVQLKMLHEGVRGLLSEIDMRQDSNWGRQVAALRADISATLRPVIESVPARVRRLLRQRPVNDITPATHLDNIEVDETVGLLQVIETCRVYADELAVNQVSTKSRAEIVQYVGPTADAAIAALRGCDSRILGFRREQADAAIAFSKVLFGADHAGLMRRSADKALAEEPQARIA